LSSTIPYDVKKYIVLPFGKSQYNMSFIVYAVYEFVGSGPYTIPELPDVPVTGVFNLYLPPNKLYFGPYCAKSVNELFV